MYQRPPLWLVIALPIHCLLVLLRTILSWIKKPHVAFAHILIRNHLLARFRKMWKAQNFYKRGSIFWPSESSNLLLNSCQRISMEMEDSIRLNMKNLFKSNFLHYIGFYSPMSWWTNPSSNLSHFTNSTSTKTQNSENSSKPYNSSKTKIMPPFNNSNPKESYGNK